MKSHRNGFRVESRKYQVASFSGLNRFRRGDFVTNFAEDDHVGIASHECLDRPGKIQADRLVHLDMSHVRNAIFDRIFRRIDALLKTIHFTDRRVERRGLARSGRADDQNDRSEEHTSELQSLMRISSAVFCLKKKNNTQQTLATSSPHKIK